MGRVPEGQQSGFEAVPGESEAIHVPRRDDAKSTGIGDVFQRSREGAVSADVVPL